MGDGSAGVAVPCEAVGTVYLVPSVVYTCAGCANPGLRFEHFATTLTEHFPIVHAAKHYFGLPVMAALDVEAVHADLPRYGEAWHSAGVPPDAWKRWITPWLGKKLDDPSLAVDRAHPHRLERPEKIAVESLSTDQLREKLSLAGVATEGWDHARLVEEVKGVLLSHTG